MNKQLTPKQLAELSVPTFPTLTKQAKLTRWAKIVREHKHQLKIFHNLEDYSIRELDQIGDPRSAFALAAVDPVLKEAGIPERASAGDAMRFFELSQQELHEFSCYCGGMISNAEMADRIEGLAAAVK